MHTGTWAYHPPDSLKFNYPWFLYSVTFPSRDCKFTFLETYHSNQLHVWPIPGPINICHQSWKGRFFMAWPDSTRTKRPSNLMLFLDWRWDGILSTLTFSLEGKKSTIFSEFWTGIQTISFYQSEWPSSKKNNPQTMNAREDVDKMEPSCTVGGNVNWYSPCEE